MILQRLTFGKAGAGEKNVFLSSFFADSGSLARDGGNSSCGFRANN